MRHNFKKKYGQNFINDKNLLKKIVSLAEIKPTDQIIEIGVGSGNLTEALVETGAAITAYEIDLDLREHLEQKFGDTVNLVFDDFMTRDIVKDLEGKSVKIIANLPYYITTPIIMKILDSKIPVDVMILMVQKEVADRFNAKNNTKSYNALSVILQYYYEIKEEIKVNRKIFFPVPNVDSSVISLKPRSHKFEVDEEVFISLVKESFFHKRKMLRNNLKSYSFEKVFEILSSLGYKETVRAEEISVDDFVLLVQKIV